MEGEPAAKDEQPGPGDRAGFETLFRSYAPRLRGYFLRRGESSAHAEELIQEVMLTVWSKAKLYDATRAALSTWVFTIARNKHIDARRRMTRPEPDPDDPCFSGGSEPPAPDESARAGERSERLRAALGQLGEEQRTTLEQLYFEGRTMQEIAHRDGVALGTVKSRARRGVLALRAVLVEHAGEDGDEL
ncbi:MAG: sigma-70 family RNA polymerase sigma factor [Myxococcales bacterium]|nr:sigma-70 family RNA polymerase sigma factor [Myxococcales bacterium]